MISYIMMDANNLKKINDSLGHNKGDEFVIILKNKTAGADEQIDKMLVYVLADDEAKVWAMLRIIHMVFFHQKAERRQIKL